MAWATPADADLHWQDAASLDPLALDDLLEAAYEQCVAYAPPLPVTDPPTPPPTSYVLANVLQAREIHAASQRGEQDVIGIGDYAIRARPLTAAVKQLLRPKRVTWVVG